MQRLVQTGLAPSIRAAVDFFQRHQDLLQLAPLRVAQGDQKFHGPGFHRPVEIVCLGILELVYIGLIAVQIVQDFSPAFHELLLDLLGFPLGEHYLFGHNSPSLFSGYAYFGGGLGSGG